jgi:hypothetical protein
MFLKVGDTAPAFTADTNADLTGASCSVKFYKLDGTLVFSRTGTVTDAPNGIVSYQWVAANDASLINAVGAYRAEVKATFAGGQVETFPQRSMLEVVVR